MLVKQVGARLLTAYTVERGDARFQTFRPTETDRLRCCGKSPGRYVASLSALQNFASFMIASAAPVLTGWLLDRTQSFTIALGVCSAVTLLGALSYGTLAAPSGMHLAREADPENIHV